MSIFNSLGSNYNLNLAFGSLFSSGKRQDQELLKKLLEEKYQGRAIFTYKGREALRLALRLFGKPNASVGICGFTCYAVYESIVKEGYKVVYFDIENGDLNFSVDVLKSAVKNNPNLKFLFIQNTLGYPCDIEEIAKFCKKNGIFLLEDLAHSIGTKYHNGKEAGTVGDFTMLSFSQDKVIDRVSGGALIIRNSKFIPSVTSEQEIINSEFENIGTNQQAKDNIYPLFTYLIRQTYQLGIGKGIHALLKQLKFLSNPMSYEGMDNGVHALPMNYLPAIYRQFKTLDKDLNHRKKIAKIYADKLNKKVLLDKICSNISFSTNLRFPILITKNKIELVKKMRKENIFISDIWYDAVIGPQKYFDLTNYQKGECPNAEEVAEKIINLPTHRNVSEEDARFIAERINKWLESQ